MPIKFSLQTIYNNYMTMPTTTRACGAKKSLAITAKDQLEPG